MPAFQYRKSSYSNAENECVEVATNAVTRIAIRDSKIPTGPALSISPSAWKVFQDALHEDTFASNSRSA
ncbi:DUF397 domain-containing protein [Streptomyces sp. NPDC020298]|uniref:DUF397 domain-containing protein n=1 Tax=unclassified Streptomyces TaxID=2593676 RepID=UPI0033C51647